MEVILEYGTTPTFLEKMDTLVQFQIVRKQTFQFYTNHENSQKMAESITVFSMFSQKADQMFISYLNRLKYRHNWDLYKN